MRQEYQKTIRKIKDEHDAIVHHRDEEGRIVFPITIREEQTVFSPFQSNHKMIGGEFAEYLDTITKGIKSKENLHLKITTKEEGVDTAIRNYYHYQIFDINRRLQRNWILFFIMLGLAAMIFILLFAIPFLNMHAVIQSIVEILGWVICWEAFDTIVFKRSTLKYEQYRYFVLFHAKITIIKK